VAVVASTAPVGTRFLATGSMTVNATC
jgi:hypothetical protein